TAENQPSPTRSSNLNVLLVKRSILPDNFCSISFIKVTPYSTIIVYSCNCKFNCSASSCLINTSRGLDPFCLETRPLYSKLSIIRAARLYPILNILCNSEALARFCSTINNMTSPSSSSSSSSSTKFSKSSSCSKRYVGSASDLASLVTRSISSSETNGPCNLSNLLEPLPLNNM